MPKTHASATVNATPKKKKRGGCRGCLRWFGYLLLVLIVIVAICAALLYRVPQKLGLMGNAAKKHLVYTPDRAAGEELLAQARARGLSTKGVYLYVLPYKNGEGTVATVTLDSREGFAFSQGGRLNPLGEVFSQIAGSAKADELDIKFVTATYVSAKGQDLMTISASRADSVAFANGSMTEQQFMTKLNGDINLPAIMGEQIDSINRMLQ